MQNTEESGEAVATPEGIETKSATGDPLSFLVVKPVRGGLSTIPATKLTPFVDKESSRQAEAIKKKEADIDYLAKSIEKRKDEIAYQKERIRSDKTSLAETKKLLKELQTKKLPVVDTAKIIERLKKHRALEGVTFTISGDLVLFFKPLWVDGQIEEDSRARSRMLVGAYKVVLKNRPVVDVTVTNLTFPNIYNPHWSINDSGRPCWGDWEKIVTEQWGAGDLYGLVTTLWAYLSSTEDGSAYSRTYLHRRKRLTSTVEAQTKGLNEIGIYIGSDTDQRGERLHGQPGYVREYSGTMLCFFAPVACNSYRGGVGNERDWYVGGDYRACSKPEADLILAKVEEVKDEDDEDKRGALRELGQRLLENPVPDPTQITIRKRIEGIIDALDRAEDLPYELVAHPLLLDETKL